MGFKSFLRQSALPADNQKFQISKRFLSEDGTPEQWELRAIGETENARIRDDCTKKVIGKGGRSFSNFNAALYNQRLCCAAVVYPDLKDAELQASYGVASDEALLTTMLISGEYGTLLEAVNEICGFSTEEFTEAKTEVKNS